jgi:hypothetical protein
MAGGNFDKFLASFLPKIPAKMYDQIMKSSPMMYMIMKQKKQWDSGGDTIKPHLKWRHATNVGSYQGYDTLDITPQDTRTDAEFKLKQLYASIIFNGYEQAASSGDLAIFKMAAIAADDAESALKDLFAQLLFKDGTGNGGKDILGLKAAVDDGTNVATYGGINRGTYAWWKAQYDGAVAALTVAKMRSMYAKCSRGGMENKPDFIVTDLNQWLAYANLVDGKTTIQQPLGKVGEEFANLGFNQISFMGIPVVYDEYCPANTMYFLNSSTLDLYTKPGLDFKPSEMVKPPNMDAKVGQIFWAGELICNQPRANGIITNLT